MLIVSFSSVVAFCGVQVNFGGFRCYCRSVRLSSSHALGISVRTQLGKRDRGQSSGCTRPGWKSWSARSCIVFSAGPAPQRNVRHQTHRDQVVSWIEWVHTGSSPADALARLGLESAAQRMSLALKEAERQGRWFQRELPILRSQVKCGHLGHFLLLLCPTRNREFRS